jgi:hypothetical protein
MGNGKKSFSPTLGTNGDYLRKFVGKLVSWPWDRKKIALIDTGDQEKVSVSRFIAKD